MAILLDNITKKYKMKEVLSKVSLSFDSKGLVILTGENGSGKTTLLNIIGLLDETYEGKISINNIAISNLKKNEINQLRGSVFNFIFQESNLIDDLTVQDNLSLFKKMKGIDSNEALFINNVDSLLPKYPATLSGGERQKIAITRGLFDGDIILCDEPVASLDYQSTIEVMDKLKEISKSKLVIIVMHSKALVEEYADRIIELKNGNVISDNVIAETKELKVSVEIKKINIKQSIFKLICSFFKKRPLKSFMFLFLILVFITLLTIVSSFVLYDPVPSIVSNLKTDDKFILKKTMIIEDEITKNKHMFEFKNGSIIYADVANQLSSEDYDYMIDSEYGTVYFTDSFEIKKGEVLVDAKTYRTITNSNFYKAGFKLIIDNQYAGIEDLQFDIVGIFEGTGIYASKSELNINNLSTNKIKFGGGMFLNNRTWEDISNYCFDSPTYIPLSYYKQEMLNQLDRQIYDLPETYEDTKTKISQIEFGYNELGISADLEIYITEDLEDNIKLSFIDFSSYDESFRNQFVDLNSTIYPTGALLKQIFEDTFVPIEGSFIVVSDKAFEDILTYIPRYSGIRINVLETNKEKIANFFLKTENEFSRKDLAKLEGIPEMIDDLSPLTISFLVICLLSLFIILYLLISTVLISKRNEIGLLQSFGFSKIISLVPTLIIVLMVLLLSLLTSFLISPSIFNFLNVKFTEVNAFNTDILFFNFRLIMLMMLSISLIFSFAIILSYRKIKKYNAKEIFKIL